ncbi:odorant receptor 67c-like [Pseudomyrmex gracilis]|uniref:odorant receptor 67c-like n=1 Tax=Pseudomyrmex gracilis TaxID=219809 RepID=UPI000995740C|nr:odorant receptor 67c-like [Pseudomyrmex gracilis]
MNFQSVNILNSRANMISGNLLPMTADDSPFPMIWRIYSGFVWLIQLIQTIALIIGVMVVPKEKAIKDGTICIVVTIEAIIMLIPLYMRKKLMRQIIEEMNDILRTADDIMEDNVKSVLKPIMVPFVMYGMIGVISITLWTITPILLIFEKNIFFYVDYNLPTAFSTEPFSFSILFWSTVLMTVGSVYLFLKKFSLDVYMMHLVLLLTAQYRYAAVKLMMLFRDPLDNDKSREKHFFTSNLWAEKELQSLCRYQNNVLRISFMLRKLLSVNFSFLYLNNVFRFCFIGVLMSTVPSMTFMEGISVTSYAMGSVTQFFLLCSSVQTLSDASTKMTDRAFEEGWYQFGTSLKRTFILLIMANNLECKLTAVEKFNLSLPSFMTIMNQSYSIALLFLRAK